MISEAIGAACKRIIDAIVRALVRSRMNPNVLTFIGLLINIGCAALFGVLGSPFHSSLAEQVIPSATAATAAPDLPDQTKLAPVAAVSTVAAQR